MSKAKRQAKRASKKTNPKKKTFLGKILKVSATVATGGANKLVTKKGRQELKKAGKTILKAVKDTTQALSFPVLIPFKVAMKTILKSKGIKPETEIGKLAQQFHDAIVLKRSSYTIIEPENVIPVAIGVIVSAVMKYFQSLKAKKEAGETISSAENQALDVAESAINQTVATVEDEAKTVIAKKSFVPLIIGVVVMLLILFGVFMSRKKTA